MTEHQALPVAGYTPQSDVKIDLVNQNKILEETILRVLDALAEHATINADRRWLALAKTHIEMGFMFANRAIFKPQRLKD